MTFDITVPHVCQNLLRVEGGSAETPGAGLFFLGVVKKPASTRAKELGQWPQVNLLHENDLLCQYLHYLCDDAQKTDDVQYFVEDKC